MPLHAFPNSRQLSPHPIAYTPATIQCTLMYMQRQSRNAKLSEIARDPHTAEGRETPMHADERCRTSACIRVHRRFQTTALVPFLFYHSRTKFDHFVNFVSTKWT